MDELIYIVRSVPSAKKWGEAHSHRELAAALQRKSVRTSQHRDLQVLEHLLQQLDQRAIDPNTITTLIRLNEAL